VRFAAAPPLLLLFHLSLSVTLYLRASTVPISDRQAAASDPGAFYFLKTKSYNLVLGIQDLCVKFF
jgi:hypothetical protein